jgi:hypothetical protein
MAEPMLTRGYVANRIKYRSLKFLPLVVHMARQRTYYSNRSEPSYFAGNLITI